MGRKRRKKRQPGQKLSLVQIGAPGEDRPIDPLRVAPKAVKVFAHRNRKNRSWQPPDPKNYRWERGHIRHLGTARYACHWLLELRAILCDPAYDGD